jgi:AcrR family transcriptional regulator
MGASVGLDREQVIAAAAELADEEGSEALTLAALAARLGIRSQSLYAHVDGLDGLRRDLAVLGQRLLAERLGRAAMGRSGTGALRALAGEFAAFAAERPGLYACAQRAPRDDVDLGVSVDAATEPWRAVLRSFGLDDDAVLHFHRALWASLHGFVTLRQQGLMTRAADPDHSLALLIDVFTAALEPPNPEVRR